MGLEPRSSLYKEIQAKTELKNNYSKKISSAFVLGSTSTVAKAICLELAENHQCKRFHLISRESKDNQELINILENL